MTSSCPTTQHIHAVASMAAGMGEPSCETIVDGVRITVHVPFEGPLNRTLAYRWIKPRAQFGFFHSFLFMTDIEPAPDGWQKILSDLNDGAAPVPENATHIVRALIPYWQLKDQVAPFWPLN